MVRREHPNNRARITLLQQKRRQRTSRSRIPRRRLTQNLLARHRRQLRADHVRQQLIRNHPNVARIRHRQQPFQRLLNHRPLAIERQHLLRSRLAAPRPEPRATPARQYHRRKPYLRTTLFFRHCPPSLQKRPHHLQKMARPISNYLLTSLLTPKSQRTPSSASALRQSRQPTPHSKAVYARSSRTARPAQPPHAHRSAASPPRPTPS